MFHVIDEKLVYYYTFSEKCTILCLQNSRGQNHPETFLSAHKDTDSSSVSYSAETVIKIRALQPHPKTIRAGYLSIFKQVLKEC